MTEELEPSPLCDTCMTLEGVHDERLNQDKKWGLQDHDDGYWLAILTEELGEVATEIQNKDKQRLREELYQVAAVAVAWIEALDRKELERMKGFN